MRRQVRITVIAFALCAIGIIAYMVWFSATLTSPSPPSRVKIVGIDRTRVRPQIVGSMGKVIVLAPDGSLWGWGQSQLGELGVISNNIIRTPRRIGKDVDWQEVATSSGFTIGLKTNGTLWAWGISEFGAGTNAIDPCLPRQFTSETDWKHVYAGAGHILAQKSDDTVWTWGFNNEGQLGDGTTKSSRTPIQCGEGVWKSIAVGAFHSAGIRPDGTLWMWGRNQPWGNQQSARVDAETNWHAVFGGEYHTVACKTDGTWWIWGNNGANLMGDTNAANHPIQISGAQTWSVVTGGNVHSLAIADDGSLWAWGVNPSGEVGDGTTLHRKTPVRVGSSTNWIAAAGSGNMSIALASDGTLWTWGIRIDIAPEIQKNILQEILHFTLSRLGVSSSGGSQLVYSHSTKPELIMQLYEIGGDNSQRAGETNMPAKGTVSPQH